MFEIVALGVIKPWRKIRRKLLTLRKKKKHKSWSRDGLGGEKINRWCCLKKQRERLGGAIERNGTGSICGDC